MDVIKLRSYWIRVDPKFNAWFLMRGRDLDKGMHMGRHVKIDAEIGVMQL